MGDQKCKKYLKGNLVDNRYLLINSLGKGSCAAVWKAYDKKRDKNLAIKLAHDSDTYPNIYNEIYFLKLFHIKHIPGVPHLIHTLKSPTLVDPYGFTMLLYHKSLHQCICSNETIINITKQLLKTLHNVHKIGIIHTDIKPSNILWENKREEKVILCDFDWACLIKNINNHKMVTTTTWYRAPEMVLRSLRLKEKDRTRRINDNVSEKIDIWSLAITIIELIMYQPYKDDIDNLNHKNPFNMNKDNKYYYDDQLHMDMIKSLKIGKYVQHPDLKDLLSQMLVIDPDLRPSCKQLLKHPIFD